MTYLLRLVACLFFLLSFNAKALVINGCTIETGAQCPHADLVSSGLQFADLSDSDLSNSDMRFANLYGANLNNANLIGANLSNANFWNAELINSDISLANLRDTIKWNTAIYTGAIYSESTIFPSGMNPETYGMIFVSEVPLPAGIYLFLSGLVGLGLMRGRNG